MTPKYKIYWKIFARSKVTITYFARYLSKLENLAIEFSHLFLLRPLLGPQYR